jgi:hypothetical protein
LFTHLLWDDNIKVGIKEIECVACTGFNWLRIGTSDGCCEHGNEHSGSMKCGESLTRLRNWYVSKKSFVRCMITDLLTVAINYL